MAEPPSITYWHRVEPSPRSESLGPGLAAEVRDPLWLLTRQWQLGEFQGQDAASPAYTSITTRSSTFDGWRAGDGALEALDGNAPLEAVVEQEARTPDLRTAIELGQALRARLADAPPAVLDAFRLAYPTPTLAGLEPAARRDAALVRLVRVCGGREIDGIAALAAARQAAPDVPAGLDLPPGGTGAVVAALAWFVDWAQRTVGPIGRDDPRAWRPDRLEYALQVSAPTPDGARITLDAHAGTYGEFDWYAFDETSRQGPSPPPGPLPPTPPVPVIPPVTVSLLPTPVRLSGMPDPRWWNFEDARLNWSGVDTDRRDLARLLVVDFMLVQGTDWFMVPWGHRVGTLVRVDQLLVRDVFGDVTLIGRADATPGWTMYSTSTPDGVSDYAVLPPGALRTTLDSPDLEEVRFVRDEQANLVWAIEVLTEDGAGRAWVGRERATPAPRPAPSPPNPEVALRYRLRSTVPVNWIPFLPVRVDATRRAVALQRAAMQRDVDGVLGPVEPVGRILRPSGLADPAVYQVREEEIARTGTRVLRGMRRTRWIDGSTHLWTSRQRRAGLGEAASGLRYDIVDRTE